jgi:hypothetical protein
MTDESNKARVSQARGTAEEVCAHSRHLSGPLAALRLMDKAVSAPWQEPQILGSSTPGVARLLDSVIYSKDRKSFAIYHST